VYDPELCTGAKHTTRPLTTQRHHIHPKYLSALLGVPVRTELTPLCGMCHDAVHHLLDHLISEGATPGHRRGAGYWRWVDEAWAWWQAGVLANP
jgi:hypothetical protein